MWSVVGLTCGLQDGYTALLLACMNGQLAVVRWLIEEKGVDYRAEKDNVSGMCFSKRSGSIVGCDVCVVMVSGEQVGCEVGSCWLSVGLTRHLQDGYTALLAACLQGHLAVVRWLIEEKGVDYRAEKSNVS